MAGKQPAFPATQPKFDLGELVRSRNFDRPGVIIAIDSECPALERTYTVLFSNAERIETKECYESDLAKQSFLLDLLG